MSTVYQCSECGNRVQGSDVDLERGVISPFQGTKGRVAPRIELECRHGGIPYTMQRVPNNSPNNPRSPRRKPE